MVVQHNLTAMNSNRMLGLTMSSQAKSTEKLSSGYKINRAADDAAGLSISEKMRKQIRGLTQASLNAQDGISAVQTAEGALTEVHDMLQRMNELAVKAANGTNSEDDRTYIQNEIDQLVTEIDRVAETTKFNETYLLKGVSDGVTSEAGQQGVEVDADLTTLTVDVAGGTNLEAGDIVFGKVTAETTGTDINATLDMASLSGTLETALNQATDGVVTITATGDGADAVYAISGTGVTAANNLTAAALAGMGFTIDVASVANNDTIQVQKKWEANSDIPAGVTAKGTITAGNLAGKDVGSEVKGTVKVDAETRTATLGTYDAVYVPDALDLSLHVGADSSSNNKIGLSIERMDSKYLGIQGLKVDGEDADNATAAIDKIAGAIQKVSTQRSALGAVQNRLEHTINNLDNVVENTTAAESQIRDTDMATEMVKYSNNQILAQAGQAMLAQANQANQGVLSLLS